MSAPLRDLLVFRHGIRSSRESMLSLCNGLRTVEDAELAPEVNNETYDWKHPVLEEGIALARRVIQLYRPDRHRRVVLIGHSQGGLLCRVAAAMLAGRTSTVTPGYSILARIGFGADAATLLGGWMSGDRLTAQPAAGALAGVIMLATPNGGAFTFGQLSVLGRVTAFGLRQLVSPFGVRDLPDLMTDRLPRLLQHYQVRGVKYLSVSGSATNRYSGLHYDDLADVPVIGRLGVRLDLPNDRVVEDSSVDLQQVPLSCEIEDMASQYEHVRAYVDCTAVHHTLIQDNPEVLNIIRMRLRQWLPFAGT